MWVRKAPSYDEDIEFKKLTTEPTMKIKLMPLLAGLITVSAVATPLLVKAQDEAPTQPPQAAHQHHQGKWGQINLSDAQKQQMRQIEKDTHDQIQSVLTSDQQAQLKTLMQQNRQGNRQGNHQKHQDIMAQLNLSDAQKAQITAIRQAQKARMDGVFTPEQKQQMQQMRQQWQQQHQQQSR
jgi:Spy/CpxP family protein refolding chaperone